MMSFTTIRRAIAEALEDLSGDDFHKFRYQLLDRREEPRVRRRAVEHKSFLEITDLLVSRFTERGALEVTLDTLRIINSNDEAQTLELKTRACMDKGDPSFRRTSSGELEINPSQEALSFAASRWPLGAAQHGGPPVTVKKPEEVEAEARAQVLSEGGNPCNGRLLLSRCTIQFGKYKGQPFKWLLENDAGYVAMLVAGHQKQRKDTTSQTPLMANKDSLTRYAIAYRDFVKAVRSHRAFNEAKQRPLQPGQEGKALVGFGCNRSMTLKSLYMSKDKEKMSYVDFLRRMESTCEKGSKMEVAVRYILQQDKKKAATIRKQKQIPRTKGQSTRASEPKKRRL